MTSFYIVLVLQLLDLASTFYGKKLGAVEVNPFLKHFSTDELVGVKVVSVALIFLLHNEINTLGWMVIIVLYFLVVANNLRVIYERRKDA